MHFKIKKSNPQILKLDIGQLYSVLFDTSSFLDAEAKLFVTEFQDKRKEEDYLAIRHCQGKI